MANKTKRKGTARGRFNYTISHKRKQYNGGGRVHFSENPQRLTVFPNTDANVEARLTVPMAQLSANSEDMPVQDFDVNSHLMRRKALLKALKKKKDKKLASNNGKNFLFLTNENKHKEHLTLTKRIVMIAFEYQRTIVGLLDTIFKVLGALDYVIWYMDSAQRSMYKIWRQEQIDNYTLWKETHIGSSNSEFPNFNENVYDIVSKLLDEPLTDDDKSKITIDTYTAEEGLTINNMSKILGEHE